LIQRADASENTTVSSALLCQDGLLRAWRCGRSALSYGIALCIK
jgi:hypothetical protein